MSFVINTPFSTPGYWAAPVLRAEPAPRLRRSRSSSRSERSSRSNKSARSTRSRLSAGVAEPDFISHPSVHVHQFDNAGVRPAGPVPPMAVPFVATSPLTSSTIYNTPFGGQTQVTTTQIFPGVGGIPGTEVPLAPAKLTMVEIEEEDRAGRKKDRKSLRRSYSRDSCRECNRCKRCDRRRLLNEGFCLSDDEEEVVDRAPTPPPAFQAYMPYPSMAPSYGAGVWAASQSVPYVTTAPVAVPQYGSPPAVFMPWHSEPRHRTDGKPLRPSNIYSRRSSLREDKPKKPCVLKKLFKSADKEPKETPVFPWATI